MAAPVGNKYATKARIWTQAINRALDRRSSRADQVAAIDCLADKLLDKCVEGDLAALKEFGDRVEGRTIQGIEVGGGERPVGVEVIKRIVVDPREAGD